MSLEYIRRAYEVPAKRGARIIFTPGNGVEREARILSATHLLKVRFNDGHVAWLHPTWEVRYPDALSASALPEEKQ